MPATRVAGIFYANLIDLRFVTVHHLVPRFLDPLADLIESHELLHVEAVPAADLVELLLPALVGRLRRGTEAEDVDDRELLRHAEQRAHGLLRRLLADRRHPPDVVAESGRGEMRDMVEAATLCSRMRSAFSWYWRSRSLPSMSTGKARVKRKSATTTIIPGAVSSPR